MNDWQPVIGLETHIQLNTASKLFSRSPAAFTSAPNSQANELDFGLPGVLPVLNRAAVDKTIIFGLAINAQIARVSEFARKHYFYPDLPKGYQISQYQHPVLSGGTIEVLGRNGNFQVELERAHLEEDAGKLTHDAIDNASIVDLNRAGVPLLEIVSAPQLHSSADASDYAKELRALVCWLGICDGNMQEGSIRFDANVSLHKSRDEPLGTRCEIKNLNSFRFLEQAIEYEILRQSEILDGGGSINQETMLFSPATGKTRAMRSKEEAEDYRYMPDPDLLPLHIDEQWIANCQSRLPELPADCRKRLINEMKLSAYDAGVITAERSTVAYFEQVTRLCHDPQAAANWISGDLAAMCNKQGIAIDAAPIPAEQLSKLICQMQSGKISGKMAKDLLVRMWSSTQDVEAIISSEGLAQISDPEELERIVTQIIADNSKQVAQYHAGKDKLFGFFVGQVMKQTKGQANPQQLKQILQAKLASK